MFFNPLTAVISQHFCVMLQLEQVRIVHLNNSKVRCGNEILVIRAKHGKTIRKVTKKLKRLKTKPEFDRVSCPAHTPDQIINQKKIPLIQYKSIQKTI